MYWDPIAFWPSSAQAPAEAGLSWLYSQRIQAPTPITHPPRKVFFSAVANLGKGSKKIVEFSLKMGGWGQQWTDFPLFIYFFFEKNMSLNPLKLPKNHFKTNFFFQFLVGGPSSAMIVVIWEAQTLNLSGRAIKALWRSHFATVRWFIS